jgi:hypothetical protein
VLPRIGRHPGRFKFIYSEKRVTPNAEARAPGATVMLVPEECFIVAPISTPSGVAQTYAGDAEHCRHVIEHLLKPAAKRAGFEPLSPEAQGSDVIHGSIIRHLESCAMVLCDMSTLNANVFFELGIRTAVNKPFCLVYDEHTSPIPFDMGIVNALRYDATMSPWLLDEQIDSISDHITATYQRDDSGNALWRYFGLTTRASMKSVDATSLEEKVDFLMNQVAGLVPGRFTITGDQLSQFARAVAARLPDVVVTTGDLLSALAELDDRSRQILMLRFGFDGYGPRTLAAVGQELGLTAERIRQLEASALARVVQLMTPEHSGELFKNG